MPLQVSLAVWAPTSTKVELVLYPGLDCQPENHPMDRGSDGVWRIAGPRAWVGLYYVYRLQNFSPWTGVVETSVAPDPYSRAAGANGLSTQVSSPSHRRARGLKLQASATAAVQGRRRSAARLCCRAKTAAMTRCSAVQIADINASEFLTEGWDRCGREKPPLPHHADACVYELHVRDFSVADQTVPPHLRGARRPPALRRHYARVAVAASRLKWFSRDAAAGKYLAFELDTHGTRHLSALAEAGLTHVHLLPCYDFGTVPECAKDRAEADPGLLASFGPSSPEQQRLVASRLPLGTRTPQSRAARGGHVFPLPARIVRSRRRPTLMATTGDTTPSCTASPRALTPQTRRCTARPGASSSGGWWWP